MDAHNGLHIEDYSVVRGFLHFHVNLHLQSKAWSLPLAPNLESLHSHHITYRNYFPALAGWAVVVVVRHAVPGGFEDTLLGYAGGSLSPFQEGPGATQPGNFPAELIALTLAAAFAGTLPPAYPIHFWTDCTAAIALANGTAAPSGAGLPFATRCRALCQMAQQSRQWT